MHRWDYSSGHSPVVKLQAALCLVCRRLYPIALPYLYADLFTQSYLYQSSYLDRKEKAEKSLKLVHGSLKRNPAVWPFCRRLLVHYSEYDNTGEGEDRNPFAFLVADYLTWFTELRSLFFRGVRQERAWELVRRALENCPSLSELVLTSSGDYQLDLARVVDMLSEVPCPQLRVLGVEGISRQHGRLMSQKLQEKAGTATFSTLRTSSFLQLPSVLEDLVRWPKTLEELQIEHTFSACYSYIGLFDNWSLATLQPIFAIHKSTLRRIAVRCINRGGLAGFDLRGFPRLEELKLSSASTTSRWGQYGAEYQFLPNLFAPRLRVFHWDLTLEDQQCQEQLSDFSQEEEGFLREFASTGLRCKASLREIRITFTPETYVHATDELYPWDRMDALDREFKEKGIRVRYNPPSISRDKFLSNQERAREGARVEADAEVDS
ncbi:hypothetical protein BJX63DRAFT_381351 [Aspergillus granulosus]|uniref:Uncharacterized protein n=1 Tax=Aspergillus granulosus TaxID=176169 RepID=A0ABR4HXK3_9EURO